jgi:hypothetical protein
MTTPQPPGTPPSPPPGHPTSWLDVRVAYRGPARSHHGSYRVSAWNYCFAIPCTQTCDRFTYILAPDNPADVGLEPGHGIRAHYGEITPLPPGPANREAPRSPTTSTP